MKAKMILIVAVGFAVFSCNLKRDSESNDEISGAYAREYSFKIVNPETGSEIGLRTIRDTISIRTSENGYEVSNSKWKMNDYDKEGWQSMEHSDNRPLETFTASFSNGKSLLASKSGQVLFFDLKDHKLFIDNERQNSYEKIK